MVRINFTRMEVQELRLWASECRERQEETGMKWDEEQQRIKDKLDKVVK